MSRTVKILIGFAAAILVGWACHGPLGQGRTFVESLEAQARAQVAKAELPGIRVEAGRAPLSRTLTLSGPANDFQRNGMGELPGLTGRVASVEGVAAVRWADTGGARGIPLLAEMLAFLVPAFLIGLLIGWLLFGRPKRETYF